jgi:hypothetical protein
MGRAEGDSGAQGGTVAVRWARGEYPAATPPPSSASEGTSREGIRTTEPAAPLRSAT